MPTAELRVISGVALVIGALFMLATAAKAYGALQPWRGHAAFALGFLCLGVSHLAFSADSAVAGALSVAGALLCVGSARAVRRTSTAG